MDGTSRWTQVCRHLVTFVKVCGGFGLAIGVLVAGSVTGLIPLQLQSAETGTWLEEWPEAARDDHLTVRLASVVSREEPNDDAADDETMAISLRDAPSVFTPDVTPVVAPQTLSEPPVPTTAADPTHGPQPLTASGDRLASTNIGVWHSAPRPGPFARLTPAPTASALTSSGSDDRKTTGNNSPTVTAGLHRQQVLTMSELAMTDESGNLQPLRPQGGERALVIVCLATDCPLTRGYMSSLTRVAATWNSLGVRFCGVMLDPATTRNELLTFRHQEHVRFPLAVDRDQLLTETLKPTHTPEVFVIAADGRVVYRGRIDNRFDDAATREPFPQEFLTEALEAVVYGRMPTITRTAAIGRAVR